MVIIVYFQQWQEISQKYDDSSFNDGFNLVISQQSGTRTK